MFNLKRKIQKLLEPTVDNNVLVAQIHNAFDNAGERLLNEAKEILAKKVDIEKGERLRAIGFTSAKDAVNATAELKIRNEKEELAKLIEYYQTWYPNNKFINETTVKSICEKYGLYSAEVYYYKGDVPEKNLIEIENFKLREEDLITKTNMDDWKERQQSLMMMNALSAMNWNSQQSRPRYNSEPPTEIIKRKVKLPLQICAPETDFNMAHMAKHGHKLIPDPIVLQPVNGGYLIVSKWGLEGEDESLVNEKLN